MKIQFDGQPYTIVDFQHVKPGKGGAFVRTKLKHMRPGRVIDNTFRAGEKVELVDFEEKHMQYLYKDDRYHFMDSRRTTRSRSPPRRSATRATSSRRTRRSRSSSSTASPVTVELPNFIELADRQDRPRHPRRHRLGRLQARHARDRRGGPGAALPQRGRRGEGRHPQRRVPRPRRGGGLGDGRQSDAAAPHGGTAGLTSSRWSSWRCATTWPSSRWRPSGIRDPRRPASTRPARSRAARRGRARERRPRRQRRREAAESAAHLRHDRGADGRHLLPRPDPRRRAVRQRGRHGQGRAGRSASSRR